MKALFAAPKKNNAATDGAVKQLIKSNSGLSLQDNRPVSIMQKKQVEALANGTLVQRKANNTGLPDQLKSGIENLSGHSMDDVKVHYNSAKPAQLNAHAYAQGTDIHIAPGQEKHLPHEAWHVVQQKQGRVQPTMQMKDNIKLNDDKGLEKEADKMGLQSSYFTQPAVIQAFGHTLQLKQSTGLWVPSYSLDTGTASIIQLHDNRLITDPLFQDSRKTIYYFAGWITDIIDLFTQGNLYDGFSLLLSWAGDSSMLAKIEEGVRFLQHHPEVAGLLGVSLSPFLVSTFGMPLWAANIILTVLSRGTVSDSIGDLAFSLLMTGPYSSLMTQYLISGMKRRLGRSLINRGLVFAYNVGGGILGGTVNVLSRMLHGISLTGGAPGNTGERMETPSSAFGGIYSMISSWLPIERLHIIPGRRGGKINDENAAYGAAATNSMMIPNEAAGHPATALQGPAGMLEGMGMKSGLFWGRGIRPREGFLEHIAAKAGFA
ncbi:MAG: hypothetical protein JWQ66_4166 [Mucilaginibacter sp.]|nr:hypothetical protein [Mucilaginibacter sp.]